eukprot:TRINITY_DN96366_c0_g1_i1.p2 TRINITY_DN96366_c0_g1~~TRINITY_DN96366_c0_g1_i1.p2  ORF type:complete len:127 (+),score=16.03 TRINITY_DN96366_c0_g1_i1:149-529(+)
MQEDTKLNGMTMTEVYGELATLRRNIRHLEERYDTAEKARAELEEENKKFKEENKEFKEENKKFKEKVETLEKAFTEVKERYEEAEGKLAQKTCCTIVQLAKIHQQIHQRLPAILIMCRYCVAFAV